MPDEGAPPPLRVGDPLPEITVAHGDAAPWPLSRLGGGPLVLTFVRPYADAARARPARRILDRIADALDRLRADVADDTRVLVVLLDGADADPPAGIRPGWTVVDTPREDLRTLAGRLGTLLWEGTPGLPGQTFVTVVLDARLRVAIRFVGIDAWTAGDLTGAIVAAAGG